MMGMGAWNAPGALKDGSDSIFPGFGAVDSLFAIARLNGAVGSDLPRGPENGQGHEFPILLLFHGAVMVAKGDADDAGVTHGVRENTAVGFRSAFQGGALSEGGRVGEEVGGVKFTVFRAPTGDAQEGGHRMPVIDDLDVQGGVVNVNLTLAALDPVPRFLG